MNSEAYLHAIRCQGGKFVPLGPRTIFLGRPKHRIQLPFCRKSPDNQPTPQIRGYFQSKTPTVKNQNLNFQNFLSPF